MATLFAFAAGLVFGLGLWISDMILPAKVLGFLDLAGAWDPSLGLVMVGAILAGLVAFTLARRRKRSLLGFEMQLPTTRRIDRRLMAGGLLFGIGWGIAGLCPGPALVDLGTGEPKAAVFFAALLAGMALFELSERVRARRGARA